MKDASFKRGRLMPEITFVDLAGEAHELRSFRQKSHVILIVAPGTDSVQLKAWQKAIDAERKQWLWLHVQVFITTDRLSDYPPAVYAINRYNCFIRTWALDAWTTDDLQREYMYYEARHC